MVTRVPPLFVSSIEKERNTGKIPAMTKNHQNSSADNRFVSSFEAKSCAFFGLYPILFWYCCPA